MQRASVVIAVLLVAMLAVFGCDKQGDTPIGQQGGGGLPEGHPTAGQEGGGSPVMPVGEIEIVVPDKVQEKWSAVTLSIENKDTGNFNDVTVPLNSEYQVPDSDLMIKVGDFLPNFKMDGNVVTSASMEMENPAVRVTVMEGEEEIFKGWLYQKFPAIHPFQHESYGLLLKEAVEKQAG